MKEKDHPEREVTTTNQPSQLLDAIADVTRDFQKKTDQIRTVIQPLADLHAQLAQAAQAAIGPFSPARQLSDTIANVIRDFQEKADQFHAAFQPLSDFHTQLVEAAQAAIGPCSPAHHLSDAVADVTHDFQEKVDQYRTVIQPLADLHARLALTAQLAIEPVIQMVKTAEQFGVAFREAFEPAGHIREAFAGIPQEQVSIFQNTFAKLAEEYKFPWEDIEQPVFELFAKLGLTGLESYLTRSELLHVLRIWERKASKRKRQQAVQEYIFRKFRGNKHRLLNRMVRGWWDSPYMRKRKTAIRAAINAHKGKRYQLAIPALLPLIDGLSAEIVPPTAANKRQIIHAKEVAVLYHAEEAEVWSECVVLVVSALFYKNYDFHNRPPSSINRHGILHGRVVDYGTELNSYRVILLLDMIVRIAKQKAEKPRPRRS